MAQHKVSYITRVSRDVTAVEEQLVGLDCEISVHVCGGQGETVEAVKGADLIIDSGVQMPREVIEEIDRASAILVMGQGFDHVDHKAATHKGIMVVNSAGFCTEEVANHTMMLLLACAKKLIISHEIVRAGGWDPQTRSHLVPLPPIDGQVLGLISFGNISRAVSARAKAFGLEVISHDPYVAPWAAKEHRVELVPRLNQLARRSDYVSMHAPLTDETRGMIGESFFKAMKPTAYFINTSRGSTVDEQALITALRNGEIAGAGLDVFEQEPTTADNPLLTMDNVVLTPHTAGVSDVSVANSQRVLGQEAARILKGTWPFSLVNPEVRAKIYARPPAVNL